MATSTENELQKAMTPIGRACFVHVWEPHSFEAGKEGQYSLILVFDKDTDLKDLKRAAAAAAKAKWGDKANGMIKSGQLKSPFRNAADYEKYGDPFVEGSTFVTLKSKQAPGIVGPNAKQILNQMDFYAGCNARASVYAFAFDTMGNKGITFLLNNVQKTGDNTKLSGRMNAEDEFQPVAGASNSDDDDDSPF